MSFLYEQHSLVSTMLRFYKSYTTGYNIRAFATATSESQRVAIKKAAFDAKSLVSNIQEVIKTAQKRELPQPTIELISRLPQEYGAYKTIGAAVNRVLREKNVFQKEIKSALKTKRDISQLKAQQVQYRNREKELHRELKEVQSRLQNILEIVPNGIDPSVTNEEQIVHVINPRTSYEQNQDLEHSKIAEKLEILDLKTASVVSGSSWYYLLGDGALLEQALVQYALKLARNNGFTMAIPPSIVRSEVSNACGFKPRDQNGEEQTYQLANGGLCLTGTAEIPLAGLGLNKIFKQSELPKKIVGVSRSYRAEAGARGRDTKGLYRVHEFTKVELFVWSNPEQSKDELERLRAFQEELVASLELSAKVINMPYNDLGAPAYQKYDIEAWMPGRGSFGEVTSASNCTDFQSRRLNTKFKDDKQNKELFVHTLNGTAMAVPRVIVAIIENFYDAKTNKIAIPKVLQPYMDDKQYIEAQ